MKKIEYAQIYYELYSGTEVETDVVFTSFLEAIKFANLKSEKLDKSSNIRKYFAKLKIKHCYESLEEYNKLHKKDIQNCR